jgi:signal transduction histidine kinase
LAAGIGHDFGDVLTVVNGCSEWLLSRMERNHPFYERIGQIRQAGQRGAELTNQLLRLNQVKTGPSAICVNEQIRSAASSFQHLAGGDIKVRLSLIPGGGIIDGDPTQFQQAMLNLIANARDAMPDGGSLAIETSRETLPRAGESGGGPRLDVAGAGPATPQPGSYVTVTITDTGTGMGELTKSRAFDPFFTTKDFGEGTGLGLSFVVDVVRNSGGHIEVDTEVGRGTTLRLYFPEVAAGHEVGVAAAAGAMPR